MIGRAGVCALAADGEAGVADVLTQMEREMRTASGLMGLSRESEPNRQSLVTDASPAAWRWHAYPAAASGKGAYADSPREARLSAVGPQCRRQYPPCQAHPRPNRPQ